MDQSTALTRLLEASDLVKMVEELMAPGNFERLSGSSIAGARITLRTLQQSILQSHDALAGELVSRAKARAETQIVTADPPSAQIVRHEQTQAPAATSNRGISQADIEKMTALKKRDLRSSLERIIDRQQTTVE